MTTPRKALSTQKLLDQVNAAYPGRSKISDGWIGDPAHASRKSDHNPNPRGVVCAIDITHDPENGFDSYMFSEVLRLGRDPRIKNVISNRRIFSSTVKPWEWRPYNGPNAHAHHVHVSVGRDGLDLDDEEKIYDDSAPWNLSAALVPKTTTPTLPPVANRVSPEVQDRMAALVVQWEARRDAAGHITYYDSSGGREIAGITMKDHPKKFDQIARAHDRGDYAEVERLARAYVLEYTQPVAGWVTDAGLQFFLRDTWFNRGPTGAAKVLQLALGFAGGDVDGNVGSRTRDKLAVSAQSPDALLASLRRAREKYEDLVYPSRRRSNQWAGMMNRWDNAYAAAKQFRMDNVVVAPKTKAVVAAGTVAAGAAGAVVAHKNLEIGPSLVTAVFLAACIAALLIWKYWPSRR